METESLRDLMLAGVKWELVETPVTPGKDPVESKGQKANNVSTSSTGQITKSSCSFTNGSTHSMDSKSTDRSLLSAGSIIPPIAPINLSGAAARANAAAASAHDWDSLCDAVRNFTEHPLCAFTQTAVLPQSPAPGVRSLVTIITDMPSTDDEASGRILSGAAGDLLDRMLGAVGMSRGAVTICPLVFWRAPGGRTPTEEEIQIARPFVTRAIELSAPCAILTLGTLAALEIADAKLPKEHGVPKENASFRAPHSTLRILPIYHPNYLLLKPDAKRAVWDALQKLLQILQ